MDLEAFDAARVDAVKVLDCLGETVTPADAAALHRMQALASFVARDDGGTLAAFRAATELQPGFELPMRIAPEGNPLRAQYELARGLPPSARARLDAPTDVTIYVDGARSATWPTERPTVLQGLGSSGAVDHNTWVGLGEGLPAWATAPEVVADVGDNAVTKVKVKKEKRPREARERTPRTPLLAVAGGLALTSAGLYGYAWSQRATYLDDSTALDDLEKIRGRTNAAAATSAAVGGVALGVAGVAVVVPW
jgi:hypothetical protein